MRTYQLVVIVLMYQVVHVAPHWFSGMTTFSSIFGLNWGAKINTKNTTAKDTPLVSTQIKKNVTAQHTNIFSWSWFTSPYTGNDSAKAVSTVTTDKGAPQQGVHRPVIVSFVNGIYHSEKEVRDIAEYLESKFQTEVRWFYNPSSGNWVKDAYKAGFELVLRPNDLTLARALAEHLRKALKEVRADGGRVLHIAHSGGAILTYLAAKYHLSFSESSRIDVITLGAGRSLTHKYFRGRVYNYYSRNDPVLLVDNRAAQLMKKAKNETYAIVRDVKHNTTFVYLEAIAKDPIFDHAMEGPTYRKALDWEALQYRERMSQFMTREARERDVVRILRKRAANATGYHHFWSGYTTENLLTTSRLVRKYAANATNLHGVFSGKRRAFARAANGISERHLFGSPSSTLNITSYNMTTTVLTGIPSTSNTTQPTVVPLNATGAVNASAVGPIAMVNSSVATALSIAQNVTKQQSEEAQLEVLIDQLLFIDSQ